MTNADRCLDKSVANRDAIDLGYLVQGHRSIPSLAVEVAEKAYGPPSSRPSANHCGAFRRRKARAMPLKPFRCR